MSDWQPIETAKPVKTVQLYRRWPGKDVDIMGTGFLITQLDGKPRWVVRLNANFQTTHEALELLEQPTHWMPLPEPPK